MSTMTMSASCATHTRAPRAAGALGPTRPAPRSGAGPVRLTRRGRLVVLALSLLLVLGLGVCWAAGSVATERPGRPEPTRVVMVGTGETLWGIAAEIAEDGQTRAMVEKIEDLNALDSAMVEAGQRLRVPARG
jgi:hypothetical protein